MRAILVGLALTAAIGAAGEAQAPAEADLPRTLALVAQRLEGWYGRAQRVVSRETVTIQPLRADLAPAEPPRRLLFDLRVGWEIHPEGASGVPVATAVRQAVSVGGRSVRRDNDPGCMDPKPVSPEPLALLLAERQHESEFTSAGRGRVDNRPVLLIDFRGTPGTPSRVTWTGECVSISLPGQSRGRIWVDAATHDVLRLDERLIGEFSLPVPREQMRRGAAPTMVIERAESSIRYRPVTFDNPLEQLLLPSEIQTFTVIRGIATSRVRMTQRFSEHKRFLTDSRLVD